MTHVNAAPTYNLRNLILIPRNALIFGLQVGAPPNPNEITGIFILAAPNPRLVLRVVLVEDAKKA
jgi:hypothetical protein